MEFSQALRDCRARRRMSQLDLALRAGTTQRHLSFIENGRSRPGRTLIVRLAESLELTLRERNQLLAAAGFAAAYAETSITDPALAAVRTALDHVLAGHLPYPAIVVDRWGDLVAANDAFDFIIEGADPELTGIGRNAYRLALHPRGIAPRIANLAEWARHIVDRLRHSVDSRLVDLADELAGYVPEPEFTGDHIGFAVPLHLRTSAGDVRLITTITSFATAVDVTLSELKLEAFLPADGETADILRSVLSAPPAMLRPATGQDR